MAPKRVFMLAGQSNMSGRGFLQELPCHYNSPKGVFCWSDSSEEWEQAHAPLHKEVEDPRKRLGVGPGISFGTYLHENIGDDVGLVPCAFGGSSQKEWSVGEPLLHVSVARVKKACEHDGEFSGILWYQGETECIPGEDDTDLQLYVERFHQMLEYMLEQLGNVPVLFVIVSSRSIKCSRVDTVRALQINEISHPNIIKIDSEPAEGDCKDYFVDQGLHLSTLANIELGLKMAKLYTSILLSQTEFLS